MRHLSRKHLACPSKALICALTVPLIAQSAEAQKPIAVAAQSSSQSRPATGTGRAPVALQRRQGGGYTLVFKSGPEALAAPSVLVSIDKRDLTRLNEKQISDLLAGPIGSSVVLETMTVDGRVQSKSLTREAPGNTSVSNGTPISYQSYDDRSPQNWNAGLVEKQLDLEARATQNLIMREAEEWAVQPGAPLSTAGFCAAITNYQVGNIADGDKYLKLSEESFKPGENWRVCQNMHAGKAARTLRSVGHAKEAEKLLSMLADGGMRNSIGYDDAFKTVALDQLKTDKTAALATVERYEQLRQALLKEQRRLPSPWIAEVYKQNGKYEKALEIDKQLIDAAVPWDNRWVNLQILAGNLYQQALAERAMGDKAAATASLHQSIERLKSKVTAEQIQVIERMPGVFPKLSDLEAAAKALESGKNLPDQSLPDTEEPEDLFPDIRACHEAIEKNDKGTAASLIQEYLNRYRDQAGQALSPQGEMSLYCAVLSLAREISDRGWFDLSDQVLEQLQAQLTSQNENKMVAAFLEAELAYNARQEKRDCKPYLTSLEQLLEKALPARDVTDTQSEEQQPSERQNSADAQASSSSSERLRRLAVIFYYAGEERRAGMLIDRALEAFEAENQQGATKQSYSFGSAAAEKSMLLLDQALISAKLGEFEKADRLWREVASQPALPETGYKMSVVELSSLYARNHKSDQAIALLKTVLSQSSEANDKGAGHESIAPDMALSRLLLDAGKAKEAQEIADAAAKRASLRLTMSQFLTAARCAEVAGDLVEAAQYYALVTGAGGRPATFQPGNDNFYMDKAVALADKSPNISKKKLAHICNLVGDSKAIKHPKEAYLLYKRACDLTDETDPQKQILLVKLANIVIYTGESNGAAGDQAEQPAHVGLGLAGNDAGKAPVIDPQLRQEQLKYREEAARVAENNHRSNARFLWEQMALDEVSDGLISKALEHEKHVLDLYSAEDAAAHLDALDNRRSIVPLLISGEHRAEAEQLLLDAVKRTRAVAGDKSRVAQAQVTDLFVFYAGLKNYAAALNVLDQFLQFDLTTGGTPSQFRPNPFDAAQQTTTAALMIRVVHAIKRAQTADQNFARTALAKILKAQEAVLKSKDERLVMTLGALGDLFFQMGKYSEAEKYYDQAYAINKLYHKGLYAVRQVGRYFIPNLQKLGKTAEAERLSKLPFEGFGKP